MDNLTIKNKFFNANITTKPMTSSLAQFMGITYDTYLIPAHPGPEEFNSHK